MRIFLLTMLWWSMTPWAFADLVCTSKSTGALLQYQSEGTPGTCLKQTGFDPSDIQEQIVSHDQWTNVLKPVLLDVPESKQHDDEKKARDAKKKALETKLSLTDQDLKDLRDVLLGN